MEDNLNMNLYITENLTARNILLLINNYYLSNYCLAAVASYRR